MIRDINPHALKRIIIGVLVLLAAWFFLSCNVERKVNRALGVVIGSERGFDSITGVVLRLHPCIVDSIVRFLPGDTVTIGDVIEVEHIRDTGSAHHDTVKIKRTIKLLVHDTTIIDRTDKRELNRAINTSGKLMIENAKITGERDEARALGKKEKQRGDKFLYVLISLGVAWLLREILALYIKSKRLK